MMLKQHKSLMAGIIIGSLALFGAAAQEGGGTTAADFLIFPPASRADAMGGVLDGLGYDLEGIHFNPAVLAPLADFRVQLNVNPLPNKVTHSQLAAGFPLFGGTAAAAVQMLNTGGFTYVNELGVPEETFSVFDAAAVLGYSHYIWKTISLGLTAKGIYSTLGDYDAWSIAADAGAAAWFETPHVGQRPKPPTVKQFEAELKKEQKGIDGEKGKRAAEATRKSAEVNQAVEALEKDLAGLNAQLEKADEAKRPPLEAKKSEVETALAARREELSAAQAEEQTAVAEIEKWYEEASAAAQARFDKKVADLDLIQQERQRLFAVIDDPTQELTEEMVNANVDSSITRTRELLDERTAAIQARKETLDQRRNARIEEIRQIITGYEAKIEQEVGPRKGELNREIEALKAQKAELEAGDPKANKIQIQALDKQIAGKEKEAQALLTDPWLKRLQDRITAKNQEIKQLEADMAAMAKTSEQAVQEASSRTEKDVKAFEKLRQELAKELKKAKLKRQLDLLSASKQKGQEKAQRNYKEKEKKLYLRLLYAMYGNEEKIFQSQLSSARDDYDLRRMDFDTEQQKEREVLDDDWAFEQRLLAGKLRESPNDSALKQELAEKEKAYKQAVSGMDKKAAEFAASENKALEQTVASVKSERRKVRLIYLQTDKPYLNTAVNLAVRNLGLPMKFAVEGYPLPAAFDAAVSYALLNVQNHNLKLATQFNWPFYDQPSLGLGLEYVFANLAYLRAGYAFGLQDPGSLDRSFSAGFGVRLALGFTEYAVDYAFRPLPDYGLLHSIGVAISF